MTFTRHIAIVLLSVLCLLSGLQTTAAQGKAVNGTVVDESGVPVVGATLQVQGTNDWTITDNDGKFSLDLQKEGTLLVSCIGYSSAAVAATPGQTLKVTLQTESLNLEESEIIINPANLSGTSVIAYYSA